MNYTSLLIQNDMYLPFNLQVCGTIQSRQLGTNGMYLYLTKLCHIPQVVELIIILS